MSKEYVLYGSLDSPHTLFRAKIVSGFYPVRYFSSKNNSNYAFAKKIWVPQTRNQRLNNLILALAAVLYSWTRQDVQILFFGCDFRRTTLFLSFCRSYSVICMGSDLIEPKASWHESAIQRLLKGAKRIAYKSSNLGKILSSLGHGSKSLQVMWGVELPSATQFTDAKKNLIVSHRGCIPFYRNDLIVSAFADFVRSGQAPHDLSLCILLGNIHDQEHVNKLKLRIEHEGISARVKFLPRMTQTDVMKLFFEARVAISMPISDGYPNSIFETAFARCVHILPKFEQFSDVRSVISSLVFAETDVRSISDGMQKALIKEIVPAFQGDDFNEKQLKFVHNFLHLK